MKDIACKAVELFKEKGITFGFAESLTGGMISEMITGVPGASGVIELGVCSYSNRIKAEILGVPREVLDEYTEYSSETAIKMAEGVRRLSGSDIGISSTGIAGPTGALPGKPAGSFWIGLAAPDGSRAWECHFSGSRDEVRLAAAQTALEKALEKLSEL